MQFPSICIYALLLVCWRGAPCECALKCRKQWGKYQLGGSSVNDCKNIAKCINDDLGLSGCYDLGCEPYKPKPWASSTLWITMYSTDSSAKRCRESTQKKIKDASGAQVLGRHRTDGRTSPLMLMSLRNSASACSTAKTLMSREWGYCWQSCGAGQYLNSDHFCSSCPDDHYMTLSSHKSRDCTAQVTCGQGGYLSGASSSAAGSCKDCGAGKYQDATNHRDSSCKDQETCDTGAKLTGASSTTEGECVPIKHTCAAKAGASTNFHDNLLNFHALWGLTSFQPAST